jgi:hypothetical protein
VQKLPKTSKDSEEVEEKHKKVPSDDKNKEDVTTGEAKSYRKIKPKKNYK